MNFLKSLTMILVAASVLSADALSIESIEHASVRNDLGALVALRNDADATAAPFVAAFLEYRIGVSANALRDTKTAKRSLKSSAKILKKLLNDQPDSVEVLTLLSNVYGMTIGVSPIKAPFLGPKAERLIQRAYEIAPDNAQVLLVRGISAYNTPSTFGGSKSKALDWLDQAIKSYAADPSDGNWGAAEAYVWRALTLDALERRADAIADLNQALAREPDYAWAQFILGNLQATG